MRILMVIVLGFALVAILAVVMAYPVKWCWNYAVVPSCGAKAIDWGQACCLMFLMGMFGKTASISKKE